MNAEEFLEHHGLCMNPFAAEDAVQDAVLRRMGDGWRHPDFAKILGDPGHPSPTVVFGERGSGKTAIRLQMERSLEEWNGRRGQPRAMVLEHDELDGMLHAIVRHEGARDAAAAIEGIRLADHVDAMLHRVVPAVVDQVLRVPGAETLRVGNLRRALRKAPRPVRRDLLILQAVYDHPSAAVRRTRRLRGALGLGGSSGAGLAATWSLLLLALGGTMALMGSGQPPRWSFVLPGGLLLACGLALGWLWMLRTARVARVARRLSRSVRVLQRDGRGFRASLHNLPLETVETALPQDRSEDARYAMLDRLYRVVEQVGYASIVVLVDRVDEPAVVAGDPQRMKALVWPLLSSRFLQHHGLAVKLLLPRELRELALRETGDFHRSARLDKQNTIEELHWTGPMLAELCDMRLKAAARSGSKPSKIEDLFDPAVGRERIATELERAGNPREAFRLVYAAIQEHLSHAGADEHRVSAGALEWVRRHRSALRTSG
jgi:hypothetical protein